MFRKLSHGLLHIGRFLRIVDEHSICLSITNIACIVVVVKIALASEPSVADLGGLLIALLAYYGKKRITEKRSKLTEEQSTVITELKTKMTEMGDRIGGIAAMVGIKNLKK